MDFTIGFPTDSGVSLVLGLGVGVLSTFAYLFSIFRDTQKGRTQPQRASWLIWSVLGSITLISQVYEGATSSLWFAVVQVVGTIIVFALSVRSGLGNGTVTVIEAYRDPDSETLLTRAVSLPQYRQGRYAGYYLHTRYIIVHSIRVGDYSATEIREKTTTPSSKSRLRLTLV